MEGDSCAFFDFVPWNYGISSGDVCVVISSGFFSFFFGGSFYVWGKTLCFFVWRKRRVDGIYVFMQLKWKKMVSILESGGTFSSDNPFS